jgi:hypothetical protein
MADQNQTDRETGREEGKEGGEERDGHDFTFETSINTGNSVGKFLPSISMS